MTRRPLTAGEDAYLAILPEPDAAIATGRFGRGEVTDLHVHYVGDCTVVEGVAEVVVRPWAFDEVLEPREVLQEFEDRRW